MGSFGFRNLNFVFLTHFTTLPNYLSDPAFLLAALSLKVKEIWILLLEL